MSSSSRAQVASNFTAERAVSQVREGVLNGVAALFREQTTSDFGIDAQVELVRDEQPSGQLLALQIKGGPSAFRSPTDGGWYFPVKAKHARYWLNHSLPVVLVLADLQTGQSYWQAVTSETLQSTGKGFKVFVPEVNLLGSASGDWVGLTTARVKDVEALFAANLQRIPPAAVSCIASLRDTGNLLAAHVLAADLAAGRSEPASALSELVRSRSEWLDRYTPHSWRAVAEYAREHQLFREAADAFVRLGELDPEHRTSRIAEAALCLVDIDDARARELVSAAANADPQLSVVLVVKALMGDAPEQVHTQLEGQTDPAARTYLANEAIRAGDVSRAIGHLELLPQHIRGRDSIQTLTARLRTSRAMTAEAAPDDLDTAHDLARDALASRRMWTDDTAGALAVFARVLAVQFRHAEVLRQAASYPHGSATDSEAADVEVALLALRSAAEQGRLDVLEDIVEAVRGDDDRSYVAAEAKMLMGATDDEHVAHERNVLARALENADKQRAFDAAVQLAIRAVDVSAQLSHVGLEASYVELVRAVALAAADPEANLRHLRALASSEILAAEIVVRILMETGAKGSAAEACDLYYSVYSLPSFLLTKGRAQIQVDDIDSAANTFERMLAAHSISGEPYVDTHTFLGEYHGSKGSWEIARDHFIAVLSYAPNSKRSIYWNLLRCHLEMTDFPAARRLIDERYTAPETEDEIRVWAQVMAETGWTDASASLAVTIARREDTAPELAVLPREVVNAV